MDTVPNLTRQEAARKAARARWDRTPPRVIRLDELTPAQRHFVLAVWEAAKSAPAAEAPDRAA